MKVWQGISTLLDLHGQVIDQENGYWVKIDAWEVDRSRDIPHGVRYSLSLHDQSGKRILGYDNAHAVKSPKKFKYAGQRLPFDHKHRHCADKGTSYQFESAYQLLADFFREIDQVLQEVDKR